MNTELTEAQRADIRQMARDVMADKDGLAQIDRDIIGYSSVRVNLPLSDTVAMAKHLAILSEAIDRARVAFAAAIAPCPAPCDPRRVKAGRFGCNWLKGNEVSDTKAKNVQTVPKCETCRWFEPEATKNGFGLCRRHTPRAVVAVPWLPKWLRLGFPVASMQWGAQWPITEPDDWCGEHTPTGATP